jgi:hypothetical protein
MAIRPEPVRRERLKQRRELKKAKKKKKRPVVEILGIPTMADSARDQVINATIAAIDADPTQLDEIREESTIGTDSRGDVRTSRNNDHHDQMNPELIDARMNNHDSGEVLNNGHSGEAACTHSEENELAHAGEVEPDIINAAMQSVNLDMQPHTPRRNPLDASPMLEQPPIAIR